MGEVEEVVEVEAEIAHGEQLAQQAWDAQTPLRSLLEAEPGVDLDLDAIFDYGHYTRFVPEVLARLDAILVPA